MELDFLSVPASSTNMGCAFLRGGLTVSKRRHSLNDESTHTAIVLSSWASIPGLVPEEEILDVFCGKSKRSKKGKELAVVLDVDSDVAIVDN